MPIELFYYSWIVLTRRQLRFDAKFSRAVIIRVLSCRDIAALPATISRYRRRDIEVESYDYLKF